MNKFNISINGYVLRSTDDYHVVAEIKDLENDQMILQWYREEDGFTFKFLVDDPFEDNKERAKTFVKLFYLMIKIVDFFMIEDNQSMMLDESYVKDYPPLKKILEMSGVFLSDNEDYFFDKNILDDLDKMDRDDYNDESDGEYGHEDFED